MMNTFFIKPTDPAIRPRDPETGERLAEAGEAKPMNSYWLRRQMAGEVEVATPVSGSPVSRETGQGKNRKSASATQRGK